MENSLVFAHIGFRCIAEVQAKSFLTHNEWQQSGRNHEKFSLVDNVTMQSRIDPKPFAWEIPPPRDPYLHFSIRRSTLYAFVGSLIVHLLVLFVVPHQRVGTGEPLAKSGDSLVVHLRPRTPPQGEQSSTATVAESQPQAPADHRQKSSALPVVAANKSRAKDRARPVNPVSPPVAAEAPVDLLAYVNAARARRRGPDGFPGRENTATAAAEHEPSEDEIRMAKVKRNLTSGTNGVFQLLSVESRTAAFSFRGWTNDSGNSRREYIHVDIGANSDIEIAIIRKMIELIRRYYKGNFNWESQRLDRVIVLSARAEDNEGLEDFLRQEFFGAGSRIPRGQ
jgi:hypothetical protein